MNLSEHVTLYIQRHTKKGESLADFLLDTLHGRTPYAKFSHQFKAVELLTFYGGFVPDQLPTLDNLPARNDSNPNASGKPAKKTKKHKVTEKELLNYDVIRMIKQDTRNGELLVDLLIHVAIEGKMSNSRRFISPSTRMRAAQELLTRGFGAVSPRRLPSGKNDGLGATISKRIRKDTDNGREAAAYLMDIVIGNPPHTKPSKRKRFTPHRRVLAACELLRRLCDIRTDHITPEHIQAYWTSQTPIDAHAREAKANAGRPDINRTGIDKATALAAMATKPAASVETPAANAAETQTAAPSEQSNTTADASKPAITTAKPASDDHHNTTDKPAADAAETQTPAVSKPSNTTNDAIDERETPAPAGEQSNTTKSAQTPPSAASVQSQDPFPPKARTDASPTAISAEAPVAAASKPVISDPPANAHKSIDSAADASNPSNTAKPADDTTPSNPSHPTPFAPKSPQVEAPKLTRAQRRQAQRKQKKALRRAQRKARSP